VQKDTLELQRQKRGRWLMLGLVVFFVSPLVLVMYMYKTNWHPEGQSVGHLISPVVAIKVPSVFQGIKPIIQDPSDVSNTLWHDKWSIVLVADNCNQACETRLYDVRQIHASLEKNMNRVQRILVTHQQAVSAIQKSYPDLLILNGPTAEVDALADQFNQSAQSALGANNVYLVDPLGNWMMAYDVAVPAKDLRKDVVQLLRYSWAG
jgi:cytochrome oxidase Cu insertion factor (SCO1/SenC/PrrC family)